MVYGIVGIILFCVREQNPMLFSSLVTSWNLPNRLHITDHFQLTFSECSGGRKGQLHLYVSLALSLWCHRSLTNALFYRLLLLHPLKRPLDMGLASRIETHISNGDVLNVDILRDTHITHNKTKKHR